MRKNIIAAAVLAALLVTGLAAQAAPGTESDPFVTRSYLTGVYYAQAEQAVLQRTQAAMADLERAALKRLAALPESGGARPSGPNDAGTFTRKSLSSGDRLELATGAGIVFEGGQGTLAFTSGALIDVTDGNLVSAGGTLLEGHRYIAAENTDCFLTIVSKEAIVSIQGDYALDSSGRVLIPFTDVLPTDWFYPCVCYAYEENLFQGVSPTQFSPNSSMTRAMLAAVLSRLAGVQGATSSAGFTDVAPTAWYASAVNWAAQAGIVNGMGEGLFAPDSNVTREQMATMLYRYAQDYLGLDVSASGDLSGFSDRAKISSWAEQPLAWATGEGIMNGYTDGTLGPGGTASRAEVAAMLQRFSVLLSPEISSSLR